MSAAEPGYVQNDSSRRPWRTAFIIYAVVLTTATHWPRLRLDLGDAPAPDTLLHMGAFGALAVLLWRTGWLRRLWVLVPIGLLWALLDEITQAMPILGRTFSWWDILAGWLGIVTAAAWIAAMQPMGGRINRLRIAVNDLAVDRMFLRGRTWAMGIAAGLLAGLPAGFTAAFIAWHHITHRALHAGLLTLSVVGGAAGLLALHRLWREERRRIASERPCLRCGRSLTDAAADDRGWAVCSGCGGRFHTGQWTLDVPLPLRARHRAGVDALIFAFPIAVLLFVVYRLLRFAREEFEFLDAAARVLGTAPAGMALVIDLAVFGMAAAAGAHVYRRRIASAVDRRGEQCVACGHIISATPAPGGAGICGECGERFFRL